MIIKKGSQGEAVKQIQRKLGLKDDGDFGQKTHDAVVVWQKANGLLDDGIVGAKTWAMMFPLVLPATPFKLINLRGHIGDNVLLQIPDVATKFNITTALRLAHFLSQCAHESGNFTAVVENLNYDANGLIRVFPSYFPTLELAKAYAFKSSLIASRVYANRMGNGNEESSDGWIFRGRGYIQLTGKNNYTAFDAFVDDDILKNPDFVSSKYPMMSAAWFFHVNGLWAICDRGANEAAVKEVTRRVSGGYNGLADRLAHFNTFYKLLS
jgi:putative chitinase